MQQPPILDDTVDTRHPGQRKRSVVTLEELIATHPQWAQDRPRVVYEKIDINLDEINRLDGWVNKAVYEKDQTGAAQLLQQQEELYLEAVQLCDTTIAEIGENVDFGLQAFRDRHFLTYRQILDHNRTKIDQLKKRDLNRYGG